MRHNLESFKDYASINATIRQIQNTLSCLGSNDLKRVIQDISFFMKETR